MNTALLAPLALLASLLPANAPAATPPRTSIALDEGWEAVSTRTPSGRPPASGWTGGNLPRLFWSGAQGGSSYAWYRRKVAVPAAWQGRRVFLRLAGAKFDCRVWIDGKPAGSRLEGYTPWELEVTRLVRPGSSHRVEIRCQDWGATFADGYTLPADYKGDLRYSTGGRTLAPVGGHFTAYGLWDGARLESRPKAFIDDVAIVPSVRRGTLSVNGAVAGAKGRVDAEVRDGASVLLRFSATPDGADGRWAIEVPFPNAPLWSPERPRLLVLRLVLRGAPGPADALETVFGFRELWAEGPDFIFNGVKRNLLATSCWPATAAQTRDQVREVLKQVKEANCVAFRLHTQPWPEIWLDEADRMGMMIIDEAALWCDGGGGYGYKDPRFWENYRTHVAGMVRRDRNHASLVMWSLENELLHCGGASTDPALESKLAELGRWTKALDPGHLITFEADLDPGGAADVIGLHYPHELPDFADWPDTAGWLEGEAVTGTGGGLMGSRGAKFRWDRKKPLYIGEYLWVPDASPAPGAIFFGDEAYTDTGAFNRRAKARSWEDQTVAYRAAGVSALCPWSMFEAGESRFPLDLNPDHNIFYQAQRGSYVPVAAYPRECDTRFFRGDAVTRTFDVFNDSVSRATLVLSWAIAPSGPNGSTTFVLEPGGRAVVPVRMTADAAESATLAAFGAVLAANGFRVHQTGQKWVIEDRAPLAAPAGTRVLLFDPAGTFGPRLAAAGLRTAALRSLEGLAKADARRTIAVIAPSSLGVSGTPTAEALPVVGRPAPGRDALHGFLARGGRILVMEQESLAGLLPGVTLARHAATMAFPAGPDPLLRGIGPLDLSWWSPGHYVSRNPVRRTGTGGARFPAVTGSRDGLDLAPVVDLPVGPGRVILLQMLAGEKFDSEPAARRLFRNALESLAESPSAVAPAVVLAGDAFAKRLEELGALFVRQASPAGDALARTTAVVADGALDAAASRAIAGWLAGASGRTFYWHEPDPASFAEARLAFGFGGLAIAPAQGPLLVPARSSSLLAGLPREDFHFLGALKGEAWMRDRDADPAVIASALMPDEEVASGITLHAAEMEKPRQAGPGEGGGVWLFSEGALSATLTIPTAGWYPVTLMAGGTPARGGWPQVLVRADGAEACRISLTRSATGPYHALAVLPAGTVRLELAFVNDSYIDGEDRNLLVRSLTVARAPWNPAGLEILALPAALVARGNAGSRVVIDTVRWTAPSGANRLRAGRYASALLANLGVPFAPPRPEPDWVPAGAFAKIGDPPYFSVSPDRMYMGANGEAEASFECAAAGRYGVCVRGSGTPFAGVFPRVRLTVDGRPAGETEVASEEPRTWETWATVELKPGRHTVRIGFLNDGSGNGEDRNLEVAGVGLRRLAD